MDFQVKQDFKYKRFSRLEYLNKEESWNKDELNLGLYYFLLEAKGEPTDSAFNQILAAKGDHASAFNYLGDIAFKLYDEFRDSEIPAYHYERALTYSENNSHAHWGLFRSTRDPRHYFKTISIDYEKGNIQLVTNKMHSFYAPNLNNGELTVDEWKQLKSICLDERVESQIEILLCCHFHLEEYEDGIALINSAKYIPKQIIEPYLQHAHIDEDTFWSKISYYERLNLMGDAESAYEQVKKEVAQGNSNLTQEAFIKYAFEAKAYDDVIELVERAFEKEKFIHSSHVLKLQHILSSQYLGKSLNEQYEKDVNSVNYFGDTDTGRDGQVLALYLAYLVLVNINKLKSILAKRDNLHQLTNYVLYKDIKANLRHDSLIGHHLYDSLVDTLQELKEQWHSKRVEDSLASAKEQELDDIEIASLLMDKGEYHKALSILSGLESSMSVNNLLGICFENLDDFDSALEHAKLALDIMLSSGEKNSTIINNYLYCLHRSSSSIDKELYEKYVELFNHSLTEGFIPHRFLHDNGNSLYKYYPFNKFTLDALVNGYFYLASAEQLNDPIELPYDNLTKDKDFVVLRPDFRLCSFSHNENSMLMWSHYAENHSGLMIEYCFEGSLPDQVGIEKIQYQHPEQRFIKKDKYLFNQYMLIKNSDWSYEKEVRLFAYKKDKVYYEKATYPNRTHNATAYIKSITVGYKFPESTVKLIQSIVATLNENRTKNLSNIVLRRAKLSDNNFFNLEYEEIV